MRLVWKSLHVEEEGRDGYHGRVFKCPNGSGGALAGLARCWVFSKSFFQFSNGLAGIDDVAGAFKGVCFQSSGSLAWFSSVSIVLVALAGLQEGNGCFRSFFLI